MGVKRRKRRGRGCKIEGGKGCERKERPTSQISIRRLLPSPIAVQFGTENKKGRWKFGTKDFEELKGTWKKKEIFFVCLGGE